MGAPKGLAPGWPAVWRQHRLEEVCGEYASMGIHDHAREMPCRNCHHPSASHALVAALVQLARQRQVQEQLVKVVVAYVNTAGKRKPKPDLPEIDMRARTVLRALGKEPRT